MRKLYLILGLGMLIGLSGCGQTGPLYMPDETQQSQQN